MLTRQVGIAIQPAAFHQGKPIEPSPADDLAAMRFALQSLNAMMFLVQIADETKLDQLLRDNDTFESLGRLGCALSDAAFTHWYNLESAFNEQNETPRAAAA